MLLNKGDKVLLLISSNHEILKKKGGNVKFMRNILQSVKIDAMRPQPFRKLIYFTCNLEVSGNPTRQNLQGRNYMVEEVKQLCTATGGGGGVNFTMTNNCCHFHLFKFSDINKQSQTLLFYTSLSIQLMQYLKKAM